MQHRIGLYPGTFDPIHSGHIAFALKALQVCKLDEVVFLPEQTPWRKQPVTDVMHRAALIEKAIQNTPGLRMVRLASKQFTVQQTLPELQRVFAHAHLTLLIGSDVAKNLHYWEGLDALVRAVSFAVGLRSQDTPEIIASSMPTRAEYICIQTPDAHITSSQIRSGTPHSLSPAALQYIQDHKLY